MSTNPKPQRKPNVTPTAAQWTLSSRAVARSLAEFTCCRAGAPDWVCARLGRLRSGHNLVAGANLSPRRAGPREGPGLSPGTHGPFMVMRVAGGQGGSCLLAALDHLGAPMIPGEDRVIWVKSSIPSHAVSPTSWDTSRSWAPPWVALPEL
uniref:Protein F n=1 Tax=Hepacivirus hominis TaxID=3052230 RepID=L7S9D8_9HEPC|nr:protein F [Hepacivirus hominis]